MAILSPDVYKGFGPKLAAGYLSSKHEIYLGKAEASGHSTCLEAAAIVLGRVGWKAGNGADQHTNGTWMRCH